MIALLISMLTPAFGHAGGSIAAIDVDRRDDGMFVLEANFGLLLGTDAGWHWICHEAITTAEATLSPRYHRLGEEGFIAVVPDEAQARSSKHRVYRSDDGCSWDPVEGLAGQPVTAVAVSPADAQVVVVVTEGDGAVWRSEDGGDSWTEALAPVEGRFLGSVRISDQGAVWAAGHDADGQLVVAWADAHGSLEVTRLDPPVSKGGAGEITLSVAATSPSAPGTAWLVAGPVTGDVLWKTVDGGRHVEQVLAVDGDIVDGDVAGDGAVWVLEGSRSPWRASDGTSFQALSGLPLGIGLQAMDDSALTTSFAEYTGLLLAEVQPDASWEAVLRPHQLTGPLACIDGTEQREICMPLWSQVEESLSIFVPVDTGDTGGADGGSADGGSADGGSADGGDAGGGDTGATTDPGGCGCSAPAGRGGGWTLGAGLLLLAGMVGRRRR